MVMDAMGCQAQEQLRKAGELLDIELLDHIVVGHNCYISMKERRLGF